jgi:hypothetical protein
MVQQKSASVLLKKTDKEEGDESLVSVSPKEGREVECPLADNREEVDRSQEKKG